jgi:hypothetical protein
MNNSGDLHENRPTISMLCLYSNLLIQAKFIWTYSRKATKDGFSPRILLLTGGSEVQCTAFWCIPFSMKVYFKNYNSSDRVSGSHQLGPSVLRWGGKQVYGRDDEVI